MSSTNKLTLKIKLLNYILEKLKFHSCLLTNAEVKQENIYLEEYFRTDAVKAIKNYFIDVYDENKLEFTIDDLNKIDFQYLNRYRGFGLVSKSILIKLINN